MRTRSTRPSRKLSLARLHAVFLLILPRIRLHGEVVFRGLKCPDRREEAIAEMLALCWLWFCRLVEQGKDPLQFPSAIATYAARAVRSGRRLCGQERSRDVLSPSAQQRHGFAVFGLPEASTLGSPLEEALADNVRTPPDEQAAFRLDWPRWLATRTERDCRVIGDLMLGERTLDVAQKHGLSPGRVSQLRRAFMQGWKQFCGDPEEKATTV